MKRWIISLTLALAAAATAVSCSRSIRTAKDITPGNSSHTALDWKYGAGDIRIQTSKLSKQLVDHWIAKTGYNIAQSGKPRVVITEVDNRTDMYISTDMIRDIFESVAIEDGRYTVVVGDYRDEGELNSFIEKMQNDPKYSSSSKLKPHQATAPQFLAKIRLTKAVTQQPRSDLEDYRMTITLYDIQTQEAIGSAWDVLSKRVNWR